MSADSASVRAPLRGRDLSLRGVPRAATALRARPELLGVLGIAAILNAWGLDINGWANAYYSAAVRSMTTSWHDFLFASLDRTGLMTVDKPPLSLWVQALSARIFGLDSLSVLLPQALMGVVAAGLTYDLVRRRFGRTAGFVAGIALAVTPITVAMSRHNNPDELLTMLCVGALWFAVRAMEDGRTRWLVLSGLFVGLGFETKMAVALFVVPGIALAYLWIAPRGRVAAVRQLLAGGVALAAAGLAWPLLVTLTPAADRPWISGTSDNSIWSLIFNYNGVGRVTGQTGAPGAIGGGGGGAFGGATGIFRLLQSGLGDQAGWLLGFAVVAGLGVLATTRLRRTDPRTGWLIAIGGAFAVTVVVFSYASGIFHPYYVSFLAPFTAALLGAGVGLVLEGGLTARIVAPLALVAGIVTELVVLGNLSGQLGWAKPVVIGVAGAGAVLLALSLSGRLRLAVIGVAMAALLAAPATWAADTIGHAASTTFPSGGPASAGGLGPGGPGGFGGRRFGSGNGFPPPAGFGLGAPSGVQGLFGQASGPGSATRSGTLGARRFRGGSRGVGGFGGGGGGGFGGGGFAGFGGDMAGLKAVTAYATAHGGGAIGVESQSSAASAILTSDADVAGLGGFSGRESTVSAAWLAMEVRNGRLRWILGTGTGVRTGQGFGAPGDTRQGSAAAFDAVAKACPAVTITASGTSTKLYDCQGRAAAIAAAAGTRP